MNFEQWENHYKPLPNHLDDNASFQDETGQGIMFETYGAELQFVQEQDKHHIWTLCEGDDDTLIVCAGFWRVNRLGYFVTKEPWSDEWETIEIDELSEESEATE